MKKMALVLLILGFTSSLFAHSGGTNAQGCHTDHRTGGYHCH
ncbi:YHYH domain-containing protein [Aliarcobacter butzleri]|nr:YHYH domain-containing protein [Aliarcobacter butzleri]MCT7646840.1 YHYH domain-containing protein [Aliarcobacter butzleri]